MHAGIMQVRPFIRTDETRNKIAFLSGREREGALHSTIPQHVLPTVYGGEAALVPLEEAVQRRLSAQKSVAAAKAAGKKATVTVEAGPGAGKSSRLASAGRAMSRWSSAAWAVVKKPVQVCQPQPLQTTSSSTLHPRTRQTRSGRLVSFACAAGERSG